MDATTSSTSSAVTAKIMGGITEADGESLNQLFCELRDSGLKVILDLSRVPIMTSTGIGKLIVLHKRLHSQNRQLVISGIHENLLAMFTSINLDKMIAIETKQLA